MASPLHSVGEHLAQRAVAETGVLADAFGRSAFNRYYYAAYLATRELLGAVEPRWTAQSHSEIPELLEKAFVRRIQGQAKALARSGAITDADRLRVSRQAASAAASMAATLRTAYAIRVTSDYEPQTTVCFGGGTFTLVNRTEGEARAWLTEIVRARATVTRILQELGLAN
jgi:hypothetical protein